MVPLSTLSSNRSLVNDVIVVIPSGMGPVTPQFSTSRLVIAVNCDRMGGMGAFSRVAPQSAIIEFTRPLIQVTPFQLRPPLDGQGFVLAGQPKTGPQP